MTDKKNNSNNKTVIGNNNIDTRKSTDSSEKEYKKNANNESKMDKEFSPEIDFSQMENSRYKSGSRKKKGKFFDVKRLKKKYLINPKMVLNIFKTDVKEIFRNPAVLVIVIGLTIVPSLYAWFNIKAFWDPYGNTKYLKVAVVNEDKGIYIRNQDLKLGQKVVDNLKENDSLDWQFVSEKKAKEGLKSGEYYAIIKIPKDFSENLTSVTKKEVHKATIDYTVNEKLNAIAPKITDKGATTIQKKVDQALVETVSRVAIEGVGGFSNLVEDINPHLDKMKESLRRLDKQLDNISKLSKIGDNTLDDLSKSLNTTKNALPTIQNTINDSKKLNADIKSSLNQMNTSFNNIVPDLKKDIELASNLAGQTSELTDTLKDKGNVVSDDTNSLLQRVDAKTANTINLLEGMINVINNINTNNSSSLNMTVSTLKETIAQLQDLNNITADSKKLLDSGQDLSSDVLSQMSKLTSSINRNLIDIVTDFDNKVSDPINKIHKSAVVVTGDLNKVMNDANKLYPSINTLVSDANNITTTLKSTTNITQSSITILKEQISDAIEAIDSIQNNKDFKEFNDVIKSNIMDRVDFLKNPVELKEKKIFKIKNYGAAMTPFYSVLAAWVGVLVLLTVLTTKVKGKMRSVDEYFGRMLLFTVLSIFQSIIISFGDFFILGVTAEHALLFSFILIFSSIVFTSIIYSLVSLFGTLGKGICIFLLVIQIGGSGGTFPIQMTPHFFKAINAVIPFTYSIDACREAIGGIYWQNLRADLVALLLFFIVPIVISVLFKEKINRLSSPMSKMLNHSFLIGH